MRAHSFLIILFAAQLFFSCNNNKREIEVKDLTLEKIEIDTPPPPPPPPSIDPGQQGKSLTTEEDFLNFWKTFREAVLNSDTNKIAGLTKFPFETRGPMDDDRVIKYNKAQFIRVFNLFLTQWNGQDLEGKTEKDDIKNTVVPDKTPIHEDYTRIGDLVFKKYDKNWKLSFAYLDNKTIEVINKK